MNEKIFTNMSSPSSSQEWNTNNKSDCIDENSDELSTIKEDDSKHHETRHVDKYPFECNSSGGMDGNLNYSTKNCEWDCRGRRIIKISQPSWLLKKPLYSNPKSDSEDTGGGNLSVFNKKCGKCNESINSTGVSNPQCMRGINNSQKQRKCSNSKNCINTKLKSKTNSLKTISWDSRSSNKQENYSSTNKHGKKPYAYFDINAALQLSSQISCGSSSRYKTTRKISEYFSLQKCINKKSPNKSSNWITLNLFEQKSISKQLEVEKSIFQNHGLYTKITHLPENTLKTDWVSRGLKTSTNENELGISAIKLFLTQDFSNKRKSDYSSNQILHSNDSATSNRKLNEIKPASKKKKSNQSNLYQYFRKYGKSLDEKKKIDNVGNLHFITNVEHSQHLCKNVKTCKWDENISVQSEKHNGHPCYIPDTPEHNYIKKSEDLEVTPPYMNSFDTIPEHNTNLLEHGDIYKEIVNHEVDETSSASSCFQMNIDEKKSANSYVMEIDAVTNNIEKNIPNNPQIQEVNNFTSYDVDNINSMSHNSVFEFQKSVTKTACELLECVSSPIITEPEIREYLEELLCEKQKTSQNITESFGTSTGTDENQDYSPRLENSTIEFVSPSTSQRCHPDEEDFHNGSNIFQYILSQECVDSNLLMNNALKSMENLSQEIIKKNSLIIDSNINSNKLLEIALKIYAQYKEISILSEAKGSTPNSLMKFNVIKKSEDCICTYKIIQISDVPHEEANINMFALWNDTVSLGSISEINRKILSGLEEMSKNKAFLYVEAEDGPCFSARTGFDIENKIKDIFEEVLNNLDGQKSPYLEIRRQTFEDCTIVNNRLELKTEENPKMIQVKYKSPSSQSKFCVIMYVLAKVLQLQVTNSKTTRRELYYQIKHLISNQSYIDRAVKAVSCMFCVGPWDLNIVAHKGMVYGNLKIVMSSTEVIDCNLPGTLIPQDVDDIVELRSSAFFILVVEKESIFYKLLEEDLPNKLVRPFLMITGKGFPDLNTSLFVRKLWMVMTIPVFIFTDADPHGVNIMTTYRFGSLANAHLSRHLAIPKAQWLGVFPSEIVKLNADKQALTQTERSFLQNMLKSPCTKINMNIERELKFMLESGYKAGIEGIIKNNNFLSEFYFPLKFHNKDFI